MLINWFTTARLKRPTPPYGEVVGLIAGAGLFPVDFARKAQQSGLAVVCTALKGAVEPNLPEFCWRFYPLGLGQLGRGIALFRKHGVRRWVMAGKIPKVNLMSPWAIWENFPDWRGLCFWFNRSRRDNRDDSLLSGIIAEYAREGMTCESALELCPELLVQAGILTRRKPTAAEEADIAFGWDLAREMGRLDVGQSVAVRHKCVLAVEAIEGTDRAIERAGTLARGGSFVVVKVAKPQQDMRFDVPTIGPSTIETMKKAGGKVLAVEAHRTILINADETVRLADEAGIAIVAR